MASLNKSQTVIMYPVIYVTPRPATFEINLCPHPMLFIPAPVTSQRTMPSTISYHIPSAHKTKQTITRSRSPAVQDRTWNHHYCTASLVMIPTTEKVAPRTKHFVDSALATTGVADACPSAAANPHTEWLATQKGQVSSQSGRRP